MRAASRWTLEPDAFEKLLASLDADRDRAGETYERIRQKLVSFFRWRGCAPAEECADTTIDRVARRLTEGAELRVSEPYLYFHGVALNVLQEHWRGAAARTGSIEGLPDPGVDPDVEAETAALRQARERRLECLDRCLATLGPRQRELLEAYHRNAGDRIASRRRLAAALGIPLNALRIRAYRVRGALEACVADCAGRITDR